MQIPELHDDFLTQGFIPIGTLYSQERVKGWAVVKAERSTVVRMHYSKTQTSLSKTAARLIDFKSSVDWEPLKEIKPAQQVIVQLEYKNEIQRQLFEPKRLKYLLLNTVVADGCWMQLDWTESFSFKIRLDGCGVITAGTDVKIEYQWRPTDTLFSTVDMIADAPYFLKATREIMESISSQEMTGHLLQGPHGVGKTRFVQRLGQRIGIPHLILQPMMPKRRREAEEWFLRQLDVLQSFEHRSLLIMDDFDQFLDMGGPFLPRFLKAVFADGKYNVSVSTTAIPELSTMFRRTSILHVPNLQERTHFLQDILSHVNLDQETIAGIAARTKGYTPTDFTRLLSEALVLSKGNVAQEHIIKALEHVGPSNLVGHTFQVPNVDLNQLKGMDQVLEQIKALVIDPFSKMDEYRRLGLATPRGILIHGPEGSGKTSLGCAIVKATGMQCIYVDTPSIRSKIVGTSEQTIQKLFERARSASPCVLLMDQLEMLLPKRGASQTSQGSDDRIVTSFLVEMDHVLSGNEPVFVVCMTREKSRIDEAVLRPGRLDIHLEIPLPDSKQKREILDHLLEDVPHTLGATDLDAITETCTTPADIVNRVRQVSMECIRKSDQQIQSKHLTFI
ncbi:P-loop containing nucleoside triphosphate hydrolase protein [Gorgonomyces haynaldii]|nr:P-loop containing nucleoside triphosphate hydrolase protein [Gorgonomyces haynaldii]